MKKSIILLLIVLIGCSQAEDTASEIIEEIPVVYADLLLKNPRYTNMAYRVDPIDNVKLIYISGSSVINAEGHLFWHQERIVTEQAGEIVIQIAIDNGTRFVMGGTFYLTLPESGGEYTF